MKDVQEFIDRFIRSKAVTPPNPGLPRLSNEERRSWWQFCLGMYEFLRGVRQHHSINHDQAGQLARLQWVVLKGTYVFAMPDPTLRAEQRRYIELCVIVAALFAVIVDDMEGIQDTFRDVFGERGCSSADEPRWPVEAEALTANWLRWQKSWEHADSPIAWLRVVALQVRGRYYPLALDEEPNLSSLDRLTPTGDPVAALVADNWDDHFVHEVHAQVDLITACEREGLAPESSELALGRYNGVPFSSAAAVLGVPKENVAKASRALRAAIPGLRDRLAPYREKRKQRRNVGHSDVNE